MKLKLVITELLNFIVGISFVSFLLWEFSVSRRAQEQRNGIASVQSEKG